MPGAPLKLEQSVAKAVTHFWQTRKRQATTQGKIGKKDQGHRSSVTGGAQMDGFIALLVQLIQEAGIPDAEIHRDKALELPGYFRPSKKWDLLVIADGHLLAVIEAKSQVGPSFGNNFNNRTEEAIGSAIDLWTAFKYGAFATSPKPWLGYLFMLEDCGKSQSPVSVHEPHFDVFPEFKGASYAKRYELLGRKLMRERHYEAAAFLMSTAKDGITGKYIEPAEDLSIKMFSASLIGHVQGYVTMRGV